MSNLHTTYQRPIAVKLAGRLAEKRRFIQVVAGPRQVGKTTLVKQVVEASSLPVDCACRRYEEMKSAPRSGVQIVARGERSEPRD